MQKWSVLLKEEDRRRFTQVKEACMNWMKSFKSNGEIPTDVFEV